MIIDKNGFIHHVFFWLKNPESKDDLQQLIEGLNHLAKARTIKEFHIGKPAGTIVMLLTPRGLFPGYCCLIIRKIRTFIKPIRFI